VRRDTAYFRISAGRTASVSDSLSFDKFGNTFSDHIHRPCALKANHSRKRWQWIQTGTVIDINKIKADSLVNYSYLTLDWSSRIILFP
jgi:hypothetical protein